LHETTTDEVSIEDPEDASSHASQSEHNSTTSAELSEYPALLDSKPDSSVSEPGTDSQALGPEHPNTQHAKSEPNGPAPVVTASERH